MHHRHRNVSYSPAGYVKAANLIAALSSQDAPLRALASHIVGAQGAAPVGRYPLLLAEWVRRNVRYAQEQGEVIQGPMHTLPHLKIGPWTIGGAGVGDCDDLVTTWAALCRALGVPAFLVGVGPSADKLRHAVGYCRGEWYELTDCQAYGCPPTRAMGVAYPRTWIAYTYDPDQRRFASLTSDVAGAPAATMGAVPDSEAVLGQIESAGVALTDIAGPGGASDAIRAGLGAAGTAASAAGTAASLASTLGMSAAAVPVVGWIAAGAALVGVGIGLLIKRGKVRRKTFRSGLEIESLVDAIVTILRVEGEDRTWIKLRLWELIPRMAGTDVPLATYDRHQVRAPFTWADGSVGRRAGVAQAVGSKKKEGETLQQHVATLETLAQSMASVPLDQRKGALHVAIKTFLAPEALNGRVGELLPEYIPPAGALDSAGQTGETEKKRSPYLWLLPIAAAVVSALVA
jgi:hypothetical protein